MQSDNNDNRRIAKNTMFMYLRMFITLCVNLFTSRVVLNALGVEDYGLYNVIGGIIAMFGFINGAMINTTSRFITFYLGKNDMKKLTEIFNMSFLIHFFIALIIVLFGETLGLWFLHNKMTIPESRMFASEWLFHLSIINMVLVILTVPYNATIVAHEKMSAFAYISILDSILKLLIALALLISPIDKLIFYGSLLFLVQTLDIFIYYLYCKKKFIETKLKLYWDKTIFKEMFGLASWSLLGNFSFLFYHEGINLMLNMFCGPAVNAARGIAVQVDNVVRQFASNIQTAINPQIIKSYAVNDKQRMFTLTYASSRYCFYLLFFISLPLALEADYILKLWLSNFPEHTVNFLRLTLISVLLETLSSPLFTINLASGKVKVYQVTISIISYLLMPVTYLILKETLIPETVFGCVVFLGILCAIARMFIIRYQVGMKIFDYIKSVLWPITFVVIGAILCPLGIHLLLPNGFFRLLSVCVTSLVVIPIVVYICGATKDERIFINNKIKYYIHHGN